MEGQTVQRQATLSQSAETFEKIKRRNAETRRTYSTCTRYQRRKEREEREEEAIERDLVMCIGVYDECRCDLWCGTKVLENEKNL